MNNSGRRYKDSARACFWSYIGIFMLLAWMALFSGCYGTYYITDADYDDTREEHAAVTYWNNQIYWGWNSGYYYYYGKPHYYPWHYYYSTCPPSRYSTMSHTVITKPVNRPTHRPNISTVRPNIIKNIRTENNTRIYVKPNRNINIKTNKSNVKIKTRKPKITKRPR